MWGYLFIWLFTIGGLTGIVVSTQSTFFFFFFFFLTRKDLQQCHHHVPLLTMLPTALFSNSASGALLPSCTFKPVLCAQMLGQRSRLYKRGCPGNRMAASVNVRSQWPRNTC